MQVSILEFGARISSIKLPVQGQLEEMTLTYKDSLDYLNDDYFIGATCGPVANRLAQAQFVIEDTLYQVSANNGKNCLHGGADNFSNQYWEVETSSVSECYVKLNLKLANLEGGFPGNRVMTVEYSLTENNHIMITCTGQSDKLTPINMTNHVYFTLGQTSCLTLQLTVASSKFLELFDDGIPTGAIKNISELGADLRTSHAIQDYIAQSTYPQVCRDEGIDHCFVLDCDPIAEPNAVLYARANGVKLKVYTDQPVMQVYTGNYLAKPFTRHAGVCLECHDYVDAPNQINFPDINYGPTDVYQSKITYAFTID